MQVPKLTPKDPKGQAFRGTALMGPVRHAKKLVRTGSLPPREAFLANATYLDDGEKTLLAVRAFGSDCAAIGTVDVLG